MCSSLPRGDQRFGYFRPQQRVLTRPILRQRLLHLELFAVHGPASGLVASKSGGVERRFKEKRHCARRAQVPIDLRAGEDAGQRIVILREDRIELVIVAARAGDRQAHEGLGGCVDLLVDDVIDGLHSILLRQRPGAQGEESGGDNSALVDPARLVRRQQIAGNLFDEKSIEGRVFVKRLHDVIAIAPGIRKNVVFVHAGRVGVARDIEPVAAPILAILRRGEQPVDDLGESILGVVRQKILDLLQGGQARQIECRTPQQRQLGGRRGRRNRLFFQLRQDEPVNGTLHPLLILDLGRLIVLYRLKGPIFLAFGKTGGHGIGGRRRSRGVLGRRRARSRSRLSDRQCPDPPAFRPAAS